MKVLPQGRTRRLACSGNSIRGATGVYLCGFLISRLLPPHPPTMENPAGLGKPRREKGLGRQIFGHGGQAYSETGWFAHPKNTETRMGVSLALRGLCFEFPGLYCFVPILVFCIPVLIFCKFCKPCLTTSLFLIIRRRRRKKSEKRSNKREIKKN